MSAPKEPKVYFTEEEDLKQRNFFRQVLKKEEDAFLTLTPAQQILLLHTTKRQQCQNCKRPIRNAVSKLSRGNTNGTTTLCSICEDEETKNSNLERMAKMLKDEGLVLLKQKVEGRNIGQYHDAFIAKPRDQVTEEDKKFICFHEDRSTENLLKLKDSTIDYDWVKDCELPPRLFEEID